MNALLKRSGWTVICKKAIYVRAPSEAEDADIFRYTRQAGRLINEEAHHVLTKWPKTGVCSRSSDGETD